MRWISMVDGMSCLKSIDAAANGTQVDVRVPTATPNQYLVHDMISCRSHYHQAQVRRLDHYLLTDTGQS